VTQANLLALLYCTLLYDAALPIPAVFSPVFELHDIKQTGPLETTTRWTMTMTVRTMWVS
jgi:hypothetical protein